MADLTEPRTPMGGVNLVIGLRPEIWTQVAASRSPADVAGFTTPVVGPGGYTMPATQYDLTLWIAGSSYDIVFDAAISMIAALRGIATLAQETVGWAYHRDLDLTGFIDGTENPLAVRGRRESPGATRLAPAPGRVGAAAFQKWAHDSAAWSRTPVSEQEAVIGRRKADSVELSDRPDSSHVARTDQDTFGTIFRRNTPYGSVLDHGTMFVGFSATQRPLAAMLESMAGVTTGERDALTHYSRPLTGAYYFVPAVDDLATFSTVVE